jgi:aminoglycoside 3-N-acetyltransferase
LRLRDQLLELGVRPGGVLVVHTAFSKLPPVEGGPQGLIDELLAALGPAGTLVMPAMSDDDDVPFDARSTPSRGMGIVADTFWRMPGVLRSDNAHSFAALGPRAAAITKPHPLDVPHGLDSPIGRVFELGGQVLLLGVGHDANTTIHLAENLAGVRYRSAKYLTLPDGRRFDYAEIDHCCENFNLMDQWLETAGRQRRNAFARLIEARDVVAVAVRHLRDREDVFLHKSGCAECAGARASMRG